MENITQDTYKILERRSKALECFYQVFGIVRKNLPFDETCEQLSGTITKYWASTDISCTRIVVYDKEYLCKLCEKGEIKHSVDIKINGQVIGYMEQHCKEADDVCAEEYTEDEAILLKTFASIIERLLELKSSKESLIKKSLNLETLINTVAYGIEECDLEGTITFTNHKVHHANVVGKKIWDSMPKEAQRNLKKYFEKLVKKQPTPTPYYGLTTTADGQVIDVRVDWNYKKDADGKLLGFISVLTDMSKEKALELEKEKQKQEIEEANIALKHIISTIEKEKSTIRESTTLNVTKNIIPIIEELKKHHRLSPAKVEILEGHLKDLTSDFCKNMLRLDYNLSPTELRVCQLIRASYTSKEISKALDITLDTVTTHKKNIRKKLELTNKKINLKSFLSQHE